MTAMSIVRSVAQRHGLTVEQLRARTKIRRLVSARAEAMLELRAADYSAKKIGLLLHRHMSTVEHFLYPPMRERKRRWHKMRRSA